MIMPDALKAQIANDILGIATLATQYRDALDFHTVSVWQVERALEAAFDAGQCSRVPNVSQVG